MILHENLVEKSPEHLELFSLHHLVVARVILPKEDVEECDQQEHEAHQAWIKVVGLVHSFI